MKRVFGTVPQADFTRAWNVPQVNNDTPSGTGDADGNRGNAGPVDVAGGEALYHALLRDLLDPAIAIDDHGVIQVASESVRSVFGYAPDELLGRNIKMLMPEPQRSEHDSHLERFRRTGKTTVLGKTRDFKVVRKDGETIDVELSINRVDVPDVTRPYFIGIFRDITDRKRSQAALRASQQRLRAMFDQGFQFVGVLDPDGTMLEANQASLESVGASREDVIGRPFWDAPWWLDDEKPRLKAAVAAAAQGEFIRFETKHLTAGGGEIDVDFSLKPVRNDDGQVVLLLPEGRDITAIRQAQRMESSMQRALAAIGESAAMLAHEIKTPVTAINMALRAVADKLGEDEQEVLHDLASRMKRLDQQMRQTLSFAKPLDLKLIVCDASSLFTEVARELKPILRAASVSIDHDIAPGTPAVRVDVRRVEEVLANLVMNSIEMMDGGGRVHLSARPGNDGQVCLRVEDDGPGVAESLRATLFRPFVTSKKEGTGLGLPICRRIVEEHGGSIEVAESGGLPGACIEIMLPAAGVTEERT